MTSKSSPVNSHIVPTTNSSLEGGSIKTNDGKRVQPLTSKSRCAIAAFVVGGVAGVVIVILGALNLFGPIGSVGFIASIASGGIVTFVSAIGLIWMIISKCKRSDDKQHDVSTHRMTDTQVSVTQKNTGASNSKDTVVSKDTTSAKLSSIASFGADCWKRYFNMDMGPEPALPKPIEAILNEPCPYFRGKQVGQTHFLVLVPGEPFSWPKLRTLVHNTLQLSDENIFDNPQEACIRGIRQQEPHWVLMLKEPVPGSCNMHINTSLNMNKDKGYRMPTLTEATVSILAHYVQNGERLFPTTEIYCEEIGRIGNLIIGCFDKGGLHIRLHDDNWVVANRGIGAVRVL